MNAALAAYPNLRFGLAAAFTNTQGGPEAFSIRKGNGPISVPEPASMALMGIGLAGLAGAIRKRRNAGKSQ